MYRGEWAVRKYHVDCPYAVHFQPELKVHILNLFLFTTQLFISADDPICHNFRKKNNTNLLQAKINFFLGSCKISSPTWDDDLIFQRNFGERPKCSNSFYLLLHYIYYSLAHKTKTSKCILLGKLHR